MDYSHALKINKMRTRWGHYLIENRCDCVYWSFTLFRNWSVYKRSGNARLGTVLESPSAIRKRLN